MYHNNSLYYSAQIIDKKSLIHAFLMQCMQQNLDIIVRERDQNPEQKNPDKILESNSPQKFYMQWQTANKEIYACI